MTNQPLQITPGTTVSNAQKLPVVIAHAGDTATVSFHLAATVSSPKVISVIISGTTFPHDIDRFTLNDPNGNPAASGYLDYNDTTTSDEQTVTGTYKIHLDPGDSDTGRLTLRVVVPINQALTITPGTTTANAPKLHVTIAQPGQTATVSFHLAATVSSPKVISVIISGTTFSRDIDRFTLNDPNGNPAASGYLDYNDTTTSDEQTVTGTYKIHLDPGDSDTGRLTLRVVVPINQALTITPGTTTANAPKLHVTIAQPGQTATVSFHLAATVSSPKVISVIISGTTFSRDIDRFTLNDPNGNPAASGYLDYNDTTTSDEQTVTGTYKIHLDPGDSDTGRLTLRVVVPINQALTITPGTTTANAPKLHVTIAQPGQTATVSFHLAATVSSPKVISVIISGTTFSRDIDRFTLNDPNGNPAASGYLDYNDTTTSDEQTVTGTYKIHLDPGDSDTGRLTLRVVATAPPNLARSTYQSARERCS